jgi:hypothetical protein
LLAANLIAFPFLSSAVLARSSSFLLSLSLTEIATIVTLPLVPKKTQAEAEENKGTRNRRVVESSNRRRLSLSSSLSSFHLHHSTSTKMSFRRRLKHKRPPAGWDKIEDTIEDFEAQMRDVVAEGHEGERRAALSWKVHRVHWEKNRFIFDLVYVRKVMSKELVR